MNATRSLPATYREPAREIPVFGRFDVAVVGAGATGICAAVAAARAGARTLLLDSAGVPGGTAASGLPWAGGFTDGKKQIIRGLAGELAGRLQKAGGMQANLDTDNWIPFDSECLKLVAIEMLAGANVQLLLHTVVADAIVEEGRIRGVIVENKGGRQALFASAVVDTSGDADVALRAGVPTEFGRASDGRTQPMTMMFHVAHVDLDRFEKAGGYAMIERKFTELATPLGFENPRRGDLSGLFRIPGRPGEVSLNVTRVLGLRGTDPVELSNAELAGRRQVREFLFEFLRPHVPGFESAYLASTAAKIGVRETRRIVGEYVMRESDITGYREQPDSIGRGAYPIDIHSPTDATTNFRSREHVPGRSYAIAYRVLVPLRVDQLLVAGRCVSATHEALSAIRVMPICMVMGQAAGTAAALSVAAGTPPRALDVKLLQQKLVADGTYLG